MSEEDLREEIKEEVEELEKEEKKHQDKEKKYRRTGEAASFVPEAGAVANEVLQEEANREERKKEKVEKEKRDLERKEEELERKMVEAENKNRDEQRDALIKALTNSNGSGGSDNSSSGIPGGLKIVFWMTLILHLFDGLTNFRLDLTITRIIIYLVLAVTLVIVYKSNIFWILSGISVAIPLLLYFLDSFLPGSVMSIIVPIAWISPVYPLAIAYNGGEQVGGFYNLFLKLWLFAVAAMFIILTVNNLVLSSLFPNFTGQVNVIDYARDFVITLWDGFWNIWTAFWSGIGVIPSAVERSLNYATGGYYTGMVEDQQGEPVGLYIEDIRVPAEEYFPGEEVFLWADIRGKSFKDTIEVQSRCTAMSEEGEFFEGEVQPESFEVFLEQFEAVQCRFDELPSGSNTVTFTSGFNFQTWAYVTYTFVDQQTRLNYLAQDKNINQDLGIERGLRPVYTPGPVSLGMSSEVPQPVGVGEDNKLSTPFGFTLHNLWTDGEISRVREFVILVPPGFELEYCDSQFEEVSQDPLCEDDPDVCASNMKAYLFSNIGTPKTFKTVNCRLKSGEESDIVPVGQKKAQKTFVIKAKYDYVLEDKRGVEVR